MQRIVLVITKTTARRIPGKMPAKNMVPTDTEAVTAYVTIGILGGITTPKVPAEAATAPAASLGYPFSFIRGTVIPPIAATVAGLDPEMAPKKADATTAILASFPGCLLTKVAIKSIKRFDIPPFSIIFPARIKKGTAINVKLSV